MFLFFNAVTLSGDPNNPDFKGFMIQGRVVADDSIRAGRFISVPGSSRPQCTGNVSFNHI